MNAKNKDKQPGYPEYRPISKDNQWPERGSWYLWISVIVLTVVALITRSPGLDPPSLFIDDLWQGLLSSMPLGDQIRLRSSSPIGFTALLGAALRLIPAPELSLQVAPFLAGLALIPVMALTVFRLTKSPPASILAAALVTWAPLLGPLSIRVKHYTLDALLVAILLLLTILAGENKNRFPALAAAALIFCLFSFSSALVAVLLIGAFAFTHLRRPLATPENRRVLVYLTMFIAGTVLLYVVVLKSQKNATLENFWLDYFPDSYPDFLTGLFALFQGLVPSFDFLPTPMGAIWRHLLAVVFIGLAAYGTVSLISRPDRRWLGIGVLLVYPVLGVVAVLHLYPLGGGRTDLFTYPVTVLLISCGFGRLCNQAAQQRFRIDHLTLICAVTALIFCIPSSARTEIQYPQGGNLPEMVARAEKALRPSDGLVILPHCSFCFAFYSDWPVSLEPCDFYATGFSPVIHHPGVHILPGRKGYNAHPEILAPELGAIIRREYSRLIFFTMDIDASDYIQDHFIRAGYYPVRKIENQAIISIVVYQRHQKK